MRLELLMSRGLAICATTIFAATVVSGSALGSAPLADAYVNAIAPLSRDIALQGCGGMQQDVAAEVSTDSILRIFSCVYRASDYRAAEILGELALAAGASLSQSNSYWLANALHLRGNNARAIPIAVGAYSHVPASIKARCSKNEMRCADLRRLLVAMEPSRAQRFAMEDAAIRAEAAAAARRRQVAARASARAAREAAREAAAIAFSDSGNGIHTTERFDVSGEWTLDWSYDCSGFSDSGGNFIVSTGGDVDTVLVNQLGSGDSGTEYVHSGGNIYLEINSECSWTVKATNSN